MRFRLLIRVVAVIVVVVMVVAIRFWTHRERARDETSGVRRRKRKREKEKKQEVLKPADKTPKVWRFMHRELRPEVEKHAVDRMFSGVLNRFFLCAVAKGGKRECSTIRIHQH